jgi:talin
MVTNVTSLLKTVKTVEDETARGTQALESSIEAISQETKVCEIANHASFMAVVTDSVTTYTTSRSGVIPKL